MTDVVSVPTGDRVRHAMREAAVTQAQAAAVIGVTQGQLSKRLSGRIQFRVGELTALAALCGVSVASLIGENTEVAA